MVATSLVTLRETFEASLVVGIVLAYLRLSQASRYNVVVWLGVLAGVLASLLLAIVLRILLADVSGSTEEVIEGITMLAAAALVSWMVLWMLGQRRTLRREIEREVANHVERKYRLGIFFLVAVSVLREGAETVLFLQAAIVHAGGAWSMFGGFLGIAVAILAAVLLFRGLLALPLRQFFTVTSFLLLLFAAGLIAHGLHELQEASVITVLATEVWDLNPALLPDGSFPLLHEKGLLGSFLKALLGYNGNPSLLEVLGYGGYLLAMAVLWRRREQETA